MRTNVAQDIHQTTTTPYGWNTRAQYMEKSIKRAQMSRRILGSYPLHCGMHAGSSTSFACTWVLQASVAVEGTDVKRKKNEGPGPPSKPETLPNKETPQCANGPNTRPVEQFKNETLASTAKSTHESSRITTTSTAALHAPQVHLASTTASRAIIRVTVLAVNAPSVQHR